MKQIEDIRKTLKNHKESLKDEYGLTEIGLFGSYVRGTQKELLGIRVDLVMKKALKPKIGKSILDEVVYL